MSRAQTIVLALVVLHALLGVMCLAMARGQYKSPALRWWGGGLLTLKGFSNPVAVFNLLSVQAPEGAEPGAQATKSTIAV